MLPVLGTVKDRAPGFEFVDAVGGFLGVEFRHAPVVYVLSAPHGIGKMDLPVIAVIDVAHGGRHAAFGHDRVGFAEEGFADQADFDAGG